MPTNLSFIFLSISLLTDIFWNKIWSNMMIYGPLGFFITEQFGMFPAGRGGSGWFYPDPRKKPGYGADLRVKPALTFEKNRIRPSKQTGSDLQRKKPDQNLKNI